MSQLIDHQIYGAELLVKTFLNRSFPNFIENTMSVFVVRGSWFVFVIIRTEDGGRQTALVVRARVLDPVICHLDFGFDI